jgi:DNA-binding transcriptional LysR family regulator
MFCDLVETKSFTRTAPRHGVTQSAISQKLSILEREVGWRLAHRNSRHFQLTSDGKNCHPHFLEITRLADELDRQLAQAKVIPSGILELAVCYSIGLHHLPPLLTKFLKAVPKVAVHVHYGSIDRVHQDVLDNVADLGLACYPQRLHGLVIEPFRRERLLLVCHPQHPLAVRPAVAIRELAGHPLVALNELHRSPFMHGVPKNQRQHFQPVYKFDQVELVKRAVEMDAGGAILPETVVRAEVGHKILAAVPFEKGGHTEPLGIIYRRKKQFLPALTRLLKFLRPPRPAAN